MPLRVAILDDYQNVALKLADWSPLKDKTEITVFQELKTGLQVHALANLFRLLIKRLLSPYRATANQQGRWAAEHIMFLTQKPACRLAAGENLVRIPRELIIV